MTLSSNNQIKFIQASRFQYKGDYGYTLVQATDNLHICKDGKLVKWEPVGGFHTIEAAERFLNARNYVSASVDFIDVASDDFAYILEAYAFRTAGDGKWITEIGDSKVFLTTDGDEAILDIESPSGQVDVRTFANLDDLMIALDAFYDEGDIYSATSITFGKTYVAAAINTRDLAKNLVRVKSSNIWAYGMNLRDRRDKAGEVLVQFKGNKGGPGDVYIYYDVPLVVWRKWLSATSKGHYFWLYIRNTYAYSKLTGDKRGKLKNAINR